MALTNFNKKQIKEKLIRIRRKKEEESAERIAEKFDLPYLDLMISPINYESINNISRKNAKQGKIIVIQRKNRIINLALTNPNDPKAKEIIEELKKKGFKCKIFVISPTSLNKGLIESYEDEDATERHAHVQVAAIGPTVHPTSAGVALLRHPPPLPPQRLGVAPSGRQRTLDRSPDQAPKAPVTSEVLKH